MRALEFWNGCGDVGASDERTAGLRDWEDGMLRGIEELGALDRLIHESEKERVRSGGRRMSESYQGIRELAGTSTVQVVGRERDGGSDSRPQSQ